MVLGKLLICVTMLLLRVLYHHRPWPTPTRFPLEDIEAFPTSAHPWMAVLRKGKLGAACKCVQRFLWRGVANTSSACVTSRVFLVLSRALQLPRHTNYRDESQLLHNHVLELYSIAILGFRL